MKARRRIIAIDPGTEVAGVAVADYECDTGKGLTLLDCDVVRAQGARPFRLHVLHKRLTKFFQKWATDRFDVAVERAWVGPNPQTAIIVGEARGVVLAVAGGYNDVSRQFDYAAYDVRKSLGVKGTKDGGTKFMVAQVVRAILRVPDEVELALDATDAAALLVHHYLQGNKLHPYDR